MGRRGKKELRVENVMIDEKVQKIRESFLPLRDKRIIIYGSGVVAKRVIEALSDFQIVGILDRTKPEGCVENIPILSWEDVDQNFADLLIIASSAKNCKEIYNRIVYACTYRKIRIFDIEGRNLAEHYALETIDMNTASYYLKNKEELQKKIDEYEAVSFDLFDTLIMRRTLEPADVFDLVELRLQDKGITIPDFKKKRRTAELQSGGKDIYHIYDILSKRLCLDEEEMQLIMNEEIQCEKEYMLPRKVMVELLNYAASQGKTVNIISDMYLTSEILADILSVLGITGYRKIYVSCEYGVGKGNGLFTEYLKDVPGKKCLHIGDNRQADILAAGKCGIDAYEIKSAYDMLTMSGFHRVLIYANRKCDRLFIGDMIAELFNDPFALYLSFGIVHMKEFRMAAKIFFAPIVVQYMQELYILLRKQSYQGILFGARDGYLLKRVYESDLVETMENKPQAIYFYTSRKLVIKATIQTKKDITDFAEYLHSPTVAQNVLSYMFRTHAGSLEIDSWISSNIETILNQSQKTKSNYMQYFEKAGIDTNGKYLFCDLVASGTVHNALNKIFKTEPDGIYLHRLYTGPERDVVADSVYNETEWIANVENKHFLEMFLTSPEPSIIDMMEGGIPVFDKETREDGEMSLLLRMQDHICVETKQLAESLQWDKRLSKDMVCFLLDLVNNTIFEGEAAALSELDFFDDIRMEQYKVFLSKVEKHN